MNIRMVLAAIMLLSALAFSGCAGYAVYEYPDYPYYYDNSYYPYGYFSFHHDFDGFHRFHGGHHEARHWGGRH